MIHIAIWFSCIAIYCNILVVRVFFFFVFCFEKTSVGEGYRGFKCCKENTCGIVSASLLEVVGVIY